MIFNYLEEFGIIYLKVLLFIKLGYRKFILKGSRGSRKTTIIVKFSIKEMVRDPQVSVIVVMTEKIKNSKTTMREFDKWITRYSDTKWRGFEDQWVKTDSNIDKRFVYSNNYGWKQEIQFIGIDELASAGGSPLKYNYFKIIWFEELTSSKDQFGIDEEKRLEKYDGIETFKLTALRHFQGNKQKFDWESERNYKQRTKHLGLIEFYTFNPYNAGDPLLINFNEYLPDNQKKLEKYGYDFGYNKELKEVYMTSNYRLNKYLDPEWHIEMEKIKKKNYAYWLIVALGMNGKPINTIYEDVMHIIDKNERVVPACSGYGYSGFKNMFMMIDIGKGGKGEMTLLLVGKLMNGQYVPLREWGSGRWVKEKKFDILKITEEMIEQISRWQKEFITFDFIKEFYLFLDDDNAYLELFIKVLGEKIEKFPLKSKPVFRLFKEKYRKRWEKEERIMPIKYLIGQEIIVYYQKITPKLVEQLRNQKTKDNGKVIDGNDDYLQAFEQLLYHVVQETKIKNIKEGLPLIKEFENFN